jgi:hypothetical protein
MKYGSAAIFGVTLLCLAFYSSIVISKEDDGGANKHHVEKCFVSELKTVFNDPMKFDRKLFCGPVYVYYEREFLAFFDRPMSADDPAKLEIAMLPEELSRSRVDALSSISGQRVMVRGILKVDRFCVRTRSKIMRSCAPVSIPIYISDITYGKMGLR